jgi:hypothetical protein
MMKLLHQIWETLALVCNINELKEFLEHASRTEDRGTGTVMKFKQFAIPLIIAVIITLSILLLISLKVTGGLP